MSQRLISLRALRDLTLFSQSSHGADIGFARHDFYDIAGLRDAIWRRRIVVDDGAHALMTDLRVDGVGEIDRGGALGQFLEITVRCEDSDTIRWRIIPLRRLREEVFRHPGPARRDPTLGDQMRFMCADDHGQDDTWLVAQSGCGCHGTGLTSGSRYSPTPDP